MLTGSALSISIVGEEEEVSIKQVADAIVKSIGFTGQVIVSSSIADLIDR